MSALSSLGIDPMSMLVYASNTGLVLVVLTYLLYKPAFKMMDERRNKIKSSLESAEKLQAEIASQREALELAKQEAEEKLRNEMAELHAYTEKKRAELTAEMEAARTAMLEKAHHDIEAKKASMVQDVEKELLDFMVKAILNIVENQVPEDVVKASVSSAWKTYASK